MIDASAVLALLFGEPGADAVCDCLRHGIIGVANLAEVLAKLSDHGLPTRVAGLSLGDRACLTPAAELSLPALTADPWAGLAERIGVDVRVIR